MFELTVLAVFALAIGLVLQIRKLAPRFAGLCFLIAGIGVAGWAGTVLAGVGGWIGTASDSLGGQLLGAGLAGAVTAGALTWLWADLRKKGKVSKALPVVALLVPSLLPALFGAFAAIPGLSGVSSTVGTLYAQLGG